MNSTPFQPQRNDSNQPASYHQTSYPHTSAVPGSTASTGYASAATTIMQPPGAMQPAVATNSTAARTSPEPNSRMAIQINKFNQVWQDLRTSFQRAGSFEERCQQAFDLANDLFGHSPTWVCFYRGLLGGSGMVNMIFTDHDEYGKFLRSDQYHQIQLMLTALRSRDLPENDPNDPQRMITVRLPKSLHEAMCEEAGRLNISVNRLCISRMLQLLDPKMIPETHSKPRGRKPRTRSNPGQS